jgi:hypothetical protein
VIAVPAKSDVIADLYRATATPRMVNVPGMLFLMIDGHGDPNTSSSYQDALQALYALSYSLKFQIKRLSGSDYKVGSLEGLWWAPDLSAFGTGDKSAWDWTMIIRQPDMVTEDLLADTIKQVQEKKGLPAAANVRLERFTEGRAAQILHVGPYSTEGPTIARLHAFIDEQGFTFDGRVQKHHEIYLGDPRRAAPERLRTIIRQPVA